MTFDFWSNLPTEINRILTIMICFLLAIIITMAGVLTPLSEQDINNLGGGLEETQTTIKQLPGFQRVSFIFGNNLMICLVGFVPVVGTILEYYVLYSTGATITAYAAYKDVPLDPLLMFFSLFLLPFTWLEFMAYSTAIAESLWLPWRMIKGKGRREVRNTCILISICAVTLLVAAVLEVALMSILGFE